MCHNTCTDFAKTLSKRAKYSAVLELTFTIARKRANRFIFQKISKQKVFSYIKNIERMEQMSTYTIRKKEEVKPPIETIYSGENLEQIKRFCHSLEVAKTKKYTTTKKINISFPTGSQAVSVDDRIIRLNEKRYLVVSEEEFTQLFHS